MGGIRCEKIRLHECRIRWDKVLFCEERILLSNMVRDCFCVELFLFYLNQ